MKSSENILKLLTENKTEIDRHSLDLMGKVFGVGGGSWSDEWKKSVMEMVPAGKGVRGGLLTKTAMLLNKNLMLEEVLPLAAAVELVSTALLIQDDVMDGDKLRRGMKTLHVKLGEDFRQLDMRRSERLGENVAHCMADVIFFGAFGALAESEMPNKNKVMAEFGRGFVEVGFGQARDLEMAEGDDYGVVEILEMYRLKTASYTICLPLKLGALVAGADEVVVAKLNEIGKVIGVMFQISDDMLNVFGDVKVTGKSAGSDIAENKHTILKAVVLEKAISDRRCVEMAGYFGKKISDGDLSRFKELANETGVVAYVEAMLDKDREELGRRLEASRLPLEMTSVLEQLGEYVSKRDK